MPARAAWDARILPSGQVRFNTPTGFRQPRARPGEALYELSARDLQSNLLTPFFRSVETTTTAASINVDILIPLDSAFIFGLVCADLRAGGGQTISSVFIQALFNSGLMSNLHIERGLSPTVYAVNRDFSGIIIPPGTTVRCNGVFNLGVANNTVNFNINGMIIPRGNLTTI